MGILVVFASELDHSEKLTNAEGKVSEKLNWNENSG